MGGRFLFLNHHRNELLTGVAIIPVRAVKCIFLGLLSGYGLRLTLVSRSLAFSADPTVYNASMFGYCLEIVCVLL